MNEQKKIKIEKLSKKKPIISLVCLFVSFLFKIFIKNSVFQIIEAIVDYFTNINQIKFQFFYNI